MYFMPLAIFLSAPKPLTVGYYILKSMIPALLGNIIGGGLFCGAVYWYLFLEGEEVKIHFDEMGDERKGSAFGTPMSEHLTNTTPQMTNKHTHVQNHSQQDVHPTEPSTQPLPNSGNMAVTGFAKDYQARDYGRKNSDQISGTTA
ncbi:hypothetical protein IFR05_005705 [Cadophora sp. M221]|nr:hypothetical protein IFR05_005705 [Cadophora sp. M221]